MEICLRKIKESGITTLDLTGGAPEMNPNFQWFEEASKIAKDFIVRSNLTILRANKKYYDLPEFFKKHSIHVVLAPHWTKGKTDKQRGDGVLINPLMH